MSESARDPLRGAHPFMGSAARDRPVKVADPVGPWHARIALTPVVLARGARFEVTCEWFGPDTAGNWPGGKGTQATTSHWCDSLEEARALYLRAEEMLDSGKVPNLLELSRSGRPPA